MATVKPFRAIRPAAEFVKDVAALPYDVYNRQEAKEAVANKPYSFLNIDRPETQFPDDTDMYSDKVYEKAKEMLTDQIQKGIYTQDWNECYYIYELVMDGRSQAGIVACVSIDDYLNGTVMKHENTREEKELDRIRHVDTCDAHTGPIFLAYRGQEELNKIMRQVMENDKLYEFTSEDHISHHVWKIEDKDLVAKISSIFANMDKIYIADGHHRAASAVKVGLKRREENPGYTGKEEFNYFLSVLFADESLMIMDYNRSVKDLNGLSEDEFLMEVSKNFAIENMGETPYRPGKKGEVGMYLSGNWYALTFNGDTNFANPVDALDVSILQKYLLDPILAIKDPRTDPRISYIGGIRGLEELKRRADSDMKVSFAMYPTSIGELFAVADAGLLMPPKSTWFEPKLRSGIFLHKLSE